MKVSFIKNPGGSLIPADDMEAERMKRFKNGCIYPVELKHQRNPDFHGKVFKFFRFCFEYWESPNVDKTSEAQFEEFRKQLTVLAGYHETTYTLNGDVRCVAQSLSFGAMDQETFERFYQAAIQVVMRRIFRSADRSVYEQLVSFF